MIKLATGLKIAQIQNQRTGAKDINQEWIRVVNEGTQKWDLRGWLITDETDRQVNPHIYPLPDTLADGKGWTFDPGEVLYLITGQGTNAFIPRPNAGLPPQFHFYWNRDAFVWNNGGDRVYLRHSDGQFATQPFPIP